MGPNKAQFLAKFHQGHLTTFFSPNCAIGLICGGPEDLSQADSCKNMIPIWEYETKTCSDRPGDLSVHSWGRPWIVIAMVSLNKTWFLIDTLWSFLINLSYSLFQVDKLFNFKVYIRSTKWTVMHSHDKHWILDPCVKFEGPGGHSGTSGAKDHQLDKSSTKQALRLHSSQGNSTTPPPQRPYGGRPFT